MIYVISDLNGDYDKYLRMKDEIVLKKSDDLFLLGNIIGYGKGGIDILMDAMQAENIFPVAGADELAAIKCLRAIMGEKDDEQLKRDVATWLGTKAGLMTASELSKLDEDEREDLYSYLSEEFTLLEELSVGGRDFILSSAGLGGFDSDKSLDDYTPEELTEGDFDIEGEYFDDKIIVCGYTPTHILGEKYDGKIYHGKNVICIDSGVADKRPLACLRLDDLREYYVY